MSEVLCVSRRNFLLNVVSLSESDASLGSSSSPLSSLSSSSMSSGSLLLSSPSVEFPDRDAEWLLLMLAASAVLFWGWLSFVAALIVALFFSWFPIIANGLVLTTAFPLGDEAGLPFTVPFKSLICEKATCCFLNVVVNIGMPASRGEKKAAEPLEWASADRHGSGIVPNWE